MHGSTAIAACGLLAAIALWRPTPLAAQEQVCMDGTHASAADGRTCAEHGGVDYVATNTGASSLAGEARDSASSTICVDGSKTARSAGPPTCPGTESADSAASRAVRNVTGQVGEPAKSPKHSQQPQQPQAPGSVMPRAHPVGDTAAVRKDST